MTAARTRRLTSSYRDRRLGSDAGSIVQVLRDGNAQSIIEELNTQRERAEIESFHRMHTDEAMIDPLSLVDIKSTATKQSDAKKGDVWRSIMQQ